MKAAVLDDVGVPPRFGDFAEPEPGEGQIVVDVAAAGVNLLDLAKASGSFYTGPPPVPSVVGSDGVGRTAHGRRVYFDAPVAPYGSCAQRTLVPETDLLDVAAGVDDATAAALGNTGLAAWLALSWRARLQPGESVLVLGATGAVGSVAVQAAKALGASHVIAAARNPDRLKWARQHGADAAVVLAPGADLPSAFRQAAGEHGIDVIIDPLWGEPALAAMQAATPGARHVQIGASTSPTLDLPATVIRAAELEILGFVVFRAPLQARRDAYWHLTERAARGEIAVDVIRLPLAEVASAWEQEQHGAHARLVLTP
ncbi:zinc-binding alcohol dehydrogenase family protein [Dactylosporangium fulvum]|uniref:Zinc-binding alcohol dehydrogenase family protein n=1 Tax=Dactylosporangium fulvum TaxID=53359 RepID=A0ABY5W245_9ACTN|nr:zinc-binding alcohol dehydrogenase family protein [Dactylosporangium fulvum]UWP82136.1 zinc-binding alcohol dehydrogenase family protein [Dactylosporangium fulvum]